MTRDGVAGGPEVAAQQATPFRTRATLGRGWRTWLLVLGGVNAVWTLVSALPQEPLIGTAVAVFVLVLCFLLAWMRVDVGVDGRGVRAVMFPIARRTFVAADVVEVAPTRGRGGVADGMGLRWLGNGHWAMVVGGPAVEVVLRDGARWVLSTPDPHAVAEAARRYGVST